MNKERKRKIAYEALILLVMLGALTLVIRLWLIFLLIILGIFICALRLLFLNSVKVEVIEPAVMPLPLPPPDTEKDILRRAAAVIERRITEELAVLHPAARWVWAASNALSRIEKDEPVFILLNSAGGYRKAEVKIHNLTFRALDFQTVSPDIPNQNSQSAEPVPSSSDAEEAGETTDYGFMAFEWVDTNLFTLNNRCNEAIGQGHNSLLISISELPTRESWQDICDELVRNGFSSAEIRDEGISVNLPR